MIYKSGFKEYAILAVACGLVYGLVMGLFLDSAFAGILGGILFGLFFTLFVVIFSGSLEKKMAPVRNGIMQYRRIFCEGPANHDKGINKVGGWLFFSDGFLEFFPHKMNVGGDNIAIPLGKIIGVSTSGNKLIIRTPEVEFRFVVNKVRDWEYTVRSVLHI